MRFFILSDTHGELGDAVQRMKTHAPIDFILHLGDHQRDGQKLEALVGIPSVSVAGNMDISHGKEDYRVLETEFGKIFLTHGHTESVKFGYEKLLYKATALGCKAALFGHTHTPLLQMVDGIYLLNPGSYTNPRGGRPGSYAVLTTDRECFDASILFVEKGDSSQEPSSREEKETPKKRPAGGFLRNRFNDSDGQ